MKKVAVFLLTLVAFLCANGANAQTVITQSMLPLTITTPGSYVFADNLTFNGATEGGITILTSNVTIDMKGFNYSGPLTCTKSGCTSYQAIYGIIQAAGYSNVTIENGSLNGFYTAIYVNTGIVRGLNVSNNYNGIFTTTGATVQNNVAINNASWGIVVYNGVGQNNVAYGNRFGIVGVNSTLINNAVNGNVTLGLYVELGIATGNSALNNGQDIYYETNSAGQYENACTSGYC